MLQGMNVKYTATDEGTGLVHSREPEMAGVVTGGAKGRSLGGQGEKPYSNSTSASPTTQCISGLLPVFCLPPPPLKPTSKTACQEEKEKEILKWQVTSFLNINKIPELENTVYKHAGSYSARMGP